MIVVVIVTGISIGIIGSSIIIVVSLVVLSLVVVVVVVVVVLINNMNIINKISISHTCVST